jgi:polysaccharide deacetylase 2 family uncharacterized protein YibQ
MAADDLTRPLGLPSEPGAAARRRRRVLQAGGALAAVCALTLAGWLLLPKGPTATAVIATAAAPAAPVPAVTPERTGSTAPVAPVAGLTEITAPQDGLSDIGKVVIHDPSDPAPLHLASLPNPKLIETSRDGPLPRIAEDGTRPLDAYARPSGDERGIRVAIVVGGLGIDPQGTARAIDTLPGTVTLAFAPYGDNLASDVTEARAAGHEILLQVPLEPFNYPKTDPGMNTLTVKATPAENLSRLHWFLGRLTNYVGVVNYMGARFTSEADALAPVVSEVARRGLLYLDDGSSARSRAQAVAGSGAPFLRADLVLDGELTAAAVDAELARLQAIASERGYAIATATAFPVTIERVAAFARAAAARGVTIVPVSALVPRRT